MKTIKITSRANPVVKEIRSLQDKKGRKNKNATVLEGSRLVCDACDSGAEILYIAVSEGFFGKNPSMLSNFSDHKIYVMPDELLKYASDTETPQGITAVVSIPESREAEVLSKARYIIALEGVQDPGNAGSIIRSADACGFDCVIFSRDSVDPYNPKVIRSTMGSLFHLPVIVSHDLYRTLNSLKERKIQIIAAHPRNAVPVWDADLSDNIAIIVGNEGSGLSERMLNFSDNTVMIPMPGKAESINVSAAAAMLMYETTRQRSLNGKNRHN